MDEGCARVVEPAQRGERDVSVATDQHEPAQAVRAVIPAGSPLPAEPVVDLQVAALDADLQPVAVGNGDAGASPPTGFAMRPAMPYRFGARPRGWCRLSEPTARHVLRCWRVRVNRGRSGLTNPRLLFVDSLGPPAAGR